VPVKYLELVNPEAAGPTAERVRAMQEAGMHVPGVLRMLAYRPEWSAGLNRFTQSVMRGDGLLPPWQRELIAALTSRHNGCIF
jgi:alkylhydroperoxidase family enzyme